MTGALSQIAIDNHENPLTAIKDQWEVQFSRFFNYPSLSSISPNLKSLPKWRKTRSGGTWISCSSSSTASLFLLYHHSSPDLILTVSLHGKIYEEHFISNLYFSWPQISCVSQCLTRGSRVVLTSYRDCVGQIQKFALQFSTSPEAERFINALKESLKGVMDIGFPRSDIGCSSSQSEFASNTLQYKADGELSFVTPADAYTPQLTPALGCEGQQDLCPQEPMFGHNSVDFFPALPPSFTALLTNLSAESEQERPNVTEDIDLKSQIMKYMSDSSFHDMITKVENVIWELGDDFVL